MKYKTLSTTEPQVAELQSQYKSTWHIVHLIVSVLFIPWVVVWIAQGVGHMIDNTEIDNKIEEILNQEDQ